MNTDRASNQHTVHWTQHLLHGLTNWALFIAGLANLATGTWAAFSASETLAATALAAGLVLLLAATIDRFESLKGLGIEAKTRQLEHKIDQADDALRRLREMTEITGAALIDLYSKAGRWDSAPGPRESIALAERVRKIMANLGSDDRTIAEALRPWATNLCLDMARAKSKGLQEVLRARIQELEAERQSAKRPLQPDDPVQLSLNAQISTLSAVQSSRIRSLHKLSLEDYPDKFMDIFERVPHVDAALVEPLREEAARFAQGMRSLRDERRLVETELWIHTLERDESH